MGLAAYLRRYEFALPPGEVVGMTTGAAFLAVSLCSCQRMCLSSCPSVCQSGWPAMDRPVMS